MKEIKKTMNKILDCLCDIACNPYVQSKALNDDIEKLAEMIDRVECQDEKKEER